MGYIDADCLRTELKKRLKNVRDYMTGSGMKYKGPKYYRAQGKESAYDAILNVLDSLQCKQPETSMRPDVEEYLREQGWVFAGVSRPDHKRQWAQMDGDKVKRVAFESELEDLALNIVSHD